MDTSGTKLNRHQYKRLESILPKLGEWTELEFQPHSEDEGSVTVIVSSQTLVIALDITSLGIGFARDLTNADVDEDDGEDDEVE